MPLLIGVVGYSKQDFDEETAIEKLQVAMDELKNHTDETEFVVVSGLTNIGVPKLAYKEASKRDWKTVGVSCEKAENYELYDVDERYIVGSSWGDESEFFLNKIDVLVRVGGGSQTAEETKRAKERGIPTKEYTCLDC